MKISHEQNFCRVCELPLAYPQGFLFQGGKTVGFLMVDWFNPIPPDMIDDFDWNIWKEKLIEFISEKKYIHKTKTYVIISDFGEAVMIMPKDQPCPRP